jgi:hypothetical protein
MMKYFITCDDPTDIILGMKCIKAIQKEGSPWGLYEFDSGSFWHVHKTKTGYSAREIKQ